jgi:hypothetical protein
MLPTSKFVLPYEPGYSGHRELESRRRATREWLRKRERDLGLTSGSRINSPSIVRMQSRVTQSRVMRKKAAASH